MTKLTKEQLIEQAKRDLDDRRAMAEAFPGVARQQMKLRLAEIALAALTGGMEQEPVAICTVENGEMCPDGFAECQHNLPDGTHALYAAPQLTQPAVPDDVLKRIEHEANHVTAFHHIDEHSCKVNRRDLLTMVNACRAAMLQGAEPVSQPYTLTDGWLAVPVEATLDMVKSGAKAATAGLLIPGIYRAMIAAAPKQEAK